MSISVAQLEMNLLGGSFPTTDEPKGAWDECWCCQSWVGESLLKHATIGLGKKSS